MIGIVLIGLFQVAFSLRDTLSFITRPGEHPVKLNFLNDTSASELSKDYIFCSPSIYPAKVRNTGSPHIYAPDGELIYFGGEIATNISQDFHATQYLGPVSDHLLFTDGILPPDPNAGRENRFFNSSYVEVGPLYRSVNGLNTPDGHEANVPLSANGSTFIYDIYEEVQYDLTSLGGSKHGWIFAGCFQEISLVDNSLIFQWCSHHHVKPNESYVFFHGSNQSYTRPQTGNASKTQPWDYFHFNSVEKIPGGDYIVSSRHCCAVYRVAGLQHSDPGSIIWRLGGKKNQFDKNFTFGMQHHARWHPNVFPGKTSLSLMDNASDGFGFVSNNQSRGMLIQLNETTFNATLAVEYPQPEGRLASFGGSVDLLNNQNILVGWGEVGGISEYSLNGTFLSNAIYGNGSKISYRAFKTPWIGHPLTKPAIVAYSQTCQSPKQYVYVSWNGATEVHYYKVFMGANQTSLSQLGGNFVKRGYETKIVISPKSFNRYALVQAFSAQHVLLGASDAAQVFVPLNKFATRCGHQSCGTSFKYIARNSNASMC